jgi:large subunit ribosomal protein L32
MAVPKKRTSKSRRDMRKTTWKRKAVVQAKKAISIAKSIATGKSNTRILQKDEIE